MPAIKRIIPPTTVVTPVLAPKTSIRSLSSLVKMRSTKDQVNVGTASSKTKSGKLSKNQTTNFSGTKTTFLKCLKDSGKSQWTKTKGSQVAKIYQSFATVTLPRASRTVLCSSTMKPVVPEEVREEVMFRETRTGLASQTKLTTKTITELLCMVTEFLVLIEDVVRGSVEVEVDSLGVEVVSIIAQLEAAVIVGAVVAYKTKKSSSSNLPNRAPFKTESFSAMTPDLLAAEGTIREVGKLPIP